MTDKDSIPQAIALFQEIAKVPEFQGVATTYMGALETLKGKFGFAPIRQYNHVLKGIELMQAGIDFDKNNIESRFVRGTTFFYLPKFFKTRDTAVQDFQYMIPLLLTDHEKYSPKLILNSIQFIFDNIEISPKEKSNLEEIRELMKN